MKFSEIKKTLTVVIISHKSGSKVNKFLKKISNLINIISSELKIEPVINQLEIQARYSGYLERQQDEIERRKRNENTDLPLDIDYSAVRGLSNEVCQKLMEALDETTTRFFTDPDFLWCVSCRKKETI